GEGDSEGSDGPAIVTHDSGGVGGDGHHRRVPIQAILPGRTAPPVPVPRLIHNLEVNQVLAVGIVPLGGIPQQIPCRTGDRTDVVPDAGTGAVGGAVHVDLDLIHTGFVVGS